MAEVNSTEDDLVELALRAADKARVEGKSYSYYWHTQVLANEVRALRDEIARCEGGSAGTLIATDAGDLA